MHIVYCIFFLMIFLCCEKMNIVFSGLWYAREEMSDKKLKPEKMWKKHNDVFFYVFDPTYFVLNIQ